MGGEEGGLTHRTVERKENEGLLVQANTHLVLRTCKSGSQQTERDDTARFTTILNPPIDRSINQSNRSNTPGGTHLQYNSANSQGHDTRVHMRSQMTNDKK